MLVKYLRELVDSPFMTDKFLGGSDREVTFMLNLVGSKASAMCATMVYRWIARQLIPDVPHYGNQSPSFGKDLDLVEKYRLAKQYKKYESSVKDYEVRKLLWEMQGGAINDYFRTQPYEAMVQDPESLYCHVVAGRLFTQTTWTSTNSDLNVSNMIKSIESTAAKSYAVEEELFDELGEVMPNFWIQANQSRDFFALLSVKSLSFGHALGIRHYRDTGRVAYFDPNVGEYVFPSWQKMDEVLQLYWRILWMDHDDTHGDHYPTKASFRQWTVVQYRRKPKDTDLDMFLWDTSELAL